MSNNSKLFKKFVSLLVVCTLVFQLIPALQSPVLADYVVGDDYVGDYDYEIQNPYENVDWDTWEPYKAATHVHCHISDASEDFDEMIEAYYDAGYDGVAMTDHGTVNYGWTADKPRLAIFGYQWFVHGTVSPLSEQRNYEITHGVDRGGRGMIDIPLGIELNGAAVSKCHINSYFADCGHGDLGTNETWPESAVVKSHNAGGITHLNHIGEWGGDAINNGVYNDSFVSDLADLFLTYSSCVGMELVNTSDSRTRHDRGLYDKTLQILAPLGRNIYGFCEDDSHEFSDIGRNAQFFWMPANTAENVRTSMETGAFFASSKFSKNELGDGFVATGEYPTVSRLTVDEVKDQITIECEYAEEIKMVADGNVIETISTPTSRNTVTIDLNEYEDQIGSYIRLYLTGPGGICYVQPFLLQANERPIAGVTFNVSALDTTIVVEDSSGTVMPADNENPFKYDLPEGQYTYSASRRGFIPQEGSFEITDIDVLAGIRQIINVALLEDPNYLETYFYVPETIYIEPGSTYPQKFEYYIDRENGVDGELITLPDKTSGNIFFHCPEATQVTISAGTAARTATNGSINFKTGYTVNGASVSTTISEGTLANQIAENSGTVLEWTAQYTVSDGSIYTVNAYSYVYAPQTGEAAAGMRHFHDPSFYSSVYNQGILWLKGTHEITGGTHECIKNFFIDIAPTSNTGIADWFNSRADSGSGWVNREHTSNAPDEHTSNGGTGTVYVDSSRNTNLNQLPNLEVGFWQCDLDGDGSLNSSSEMQQKADTGNTVLADFTDLGLGEIYKGTVDYENSLRQTGNKEINFYAYTNNQHRKMINHNHYNVFLSAEYVDKTSLRNSIGDAIKISRQPQWYTQSSYADYLSAFANAGAVLGKPNATQTEIDAAELQFGEAISSLVAAGSATAQVNYYVQSVEGALLQTDTVDYEFGQRVSAYANEFTGYVLDSFELYADGVLINEGTQEVSTVINAMSADYEWNFFYTPKTYSVEFDTKGCGQFEPVDGSGNTAVYGEAYHLASNTLSRTGYTFAGWLLEENNTVYMPGATLNWDIDSNSTFSAQWIPMTYNVEYDVNGGEEFIPIGTQLTVEYNSSYSLPMNFPTKTGYTIIGWNLNLDDTTYSLTASITWEYDSNGIFSAVWSANSYTVEFVDGLGGSDSLSVSATYDEDITLPEYSQIGFSRDGYIQTGWEIDGTVYQENDVVRNLATDNGSTATIQAVWQQNCYQISFDGNGGTCETSSKTVCLNESYGTLPVPERLGYSFGGWYMTDYADDAVVDEGQRVTETSIMTTQSDHTLYAYWITNEYELTINPNGGIWGATSEETTLSEDYNAVVVVPDPVRTGYSFDGWTFTGDGDWNSEMSTYTFSQAESSQAFLTANWAINSYELIVNPNGGTWNEATESSSVVRDYGTSFEISAPSRTGYTFDGWSFEGDGEWLNASQTYVFSQTDSQPDTLTAGWSANVYSVTFADTTGIVYGVIQVQYGNTVPITAIPEEALTAAGDVWYTDTGLQTPFEFYASIITGDTVLYGIVQAVVPQITVYEKTEGINDYLADKTQKPDDIDSYGNITYMDTTTSEYDYYCYTNSTDPLMLLSLGLNGVEGDYSVDTFGIGIEVLSKSSGVTAEGAGEVEYSSNADCYKYKLLTPTFTGTDSREYIVYRVTVTNEIASEIVTLSTGSNEEESFTVCISYLNTQLQGESNFESEGAWEASRILSFDTSSVQTGELVSGNDSNYTALDPIFGRENGIGAFFYVLNENDDAAIIAEYFNGNESGALNAMYDAILNGNRTVESITSGGEYSSALDTSQAMVDKGLAYVHIVDKWGNVFDGFLRLPNIDSSSAQLCGDINGALNIDEIGGSKTERISIFKYNSTDLLRKKDFRIVSSETQGIDINGNIDIISNVLVIKIGSDIVEENNGMFTVLVEDKAGNPQYVDVYVEADGLLIINIFDDFNIELNGGEYSLRDFVDGYSYQLNTNLTVNLFTAPENNVFFEKVNENTFIDRAKGIITGLGFNMTSLNGFAQAVNGSSLEYLPTSNGFGTGTVVNVLKADLVVESFVFVVYGDLDGNGRADASDCLTASLVASGLLTEQDVDSATYQAADANHDGVIDSLDAQLMELAGLFIADISQTA